MSNLEATIQVQPRLVIDRVDEAIAFYEAAFDAKRMDRYVSGSGVVVHASIRIGTSIVTMAQEMKEWQLLGPTAVGGSPVLLSLSVPDPDAACARAVARGSVVVIPIKDRPYGKREGRIRDPFGHLWILTCPTEVLSADEIARRLQAVR